MIKRLRELLNGDTTDPVNQYVLTCTITYGLSLLLSVGLFIPQGADKITFGQTLSDCLVPTTVTLTASVVLQNHAAAAGHWVATHCSLTFLSATLTLFYMLGYLCARAKRMPYLTILTAVVTLLLYWINLRAVDQVQQGLKRESSAEPRRNP